MLICPLIYIVCAHISMCTKEVRNSLYICICLHAWSSLPSAKGVSCTEIELMSYDGHYVSVGAWAGFKDPGGLSLPDGVQYNNPTGLKNLLQSKQKKCNYIFQEETIQCKRTIVQVYLYRGACIGIRDIKDNETEMDICLNWIFSESENLYSSRDGEIYIFFFQFYPVLCMTYQC